MRQTTTRNIVLTMIRQNSRVSLDALCAATGMTERQNIRYHIQQLTQQGLITYRGELIPARAKKQSKRKPSIWRYGLGKLPKLTEKQLQRRINAVVEKARRNGTLGTQRQDAFVDYWPVLRRTLKACRIG